MKHLFVAIVLLVAVGCGKAPPAPELKPTSPALQVEVQAPLSDEQVKQITEFRKLAQEDPENELAHYRLGQALQAAGQFAEAVQSYRRTLDLHPEFYKVYQLISECQVKLERRKEALASLKQGREVSEKAGNVLEHAKLERSIRKFSGFEKTRD